MFFSKKKEEVPTTDATVPPQKDVPQKDVLPVPPKKVEAVKAPKETVETTNDFEQLNKELNQLEREIKETEANLDRIDKELDSINKRK